MSNGIKADFKSTIVALFKTGGNVTTKCIKEPQVLNGEWEKARQLGTIWKVETGDEDNSVAYFNVNEIVFIAIQNYVTEEIAQQRLKTKQEIAMTKAPANKIITPGPRRM